MSACRQVHTPELIGFQRLWLGLSTPTLEPISTMATHARSPDNAYTDQRWARAETSQYPCKPPHMQIRYGRESSLSNNRRQSMLQTALSECRTAAIIVKIRVRPISFRPRETVAGQDSSDFYRSETWPDTVALPAKPAIGAPYQPFVLLLSMLHVVLAALASSL